MWTYSDYDVNDCHLNPICSTFSSLHISSQFTVWLPYPYVGNYFFLSYELGEIDFSYDHAPGYSPAF